MSKKGIPFPFEEYMRRWMTFQNKLPNYRNNASMMAMKGEWLVSIDPCCLTHLKIEKPNSGVKRRRRVKCKPSVPCSSYEKCSTVSPSLA